MAWEGALHPCDRFSHESWPSLIYASNDNSVFERVHECLCKRSGRGHQAEVSAGQIDDLEAQLPRPHLIRLVWKLVLRITSAGYHDPLCVRWQRSEIQLNPRSGFPPTPSAACLKSVVRTVARLLPLPRCRGLGVLSGPASASPPSVTMAVCHA
jgi:hypothetical protein